MGFSEEQIKALGAKLSAKHVKTRNQGGKSLSYIEGWRVVAEANRIFGFEGWDREMVACQMVWQSNTHGPNQCAYIARVRIRVRAGDAVVVREGSGFGFGSGATGGEAHEAALKEAETDATKRAMVTFGNVFGLALYDSEFAAVRGTPSRPSSSKDIEWRLRSPTGEVASIHTDPVAWCSAFKKVLREASDATELISIWNRNLETLARMRDLIPNLKTPKDEHYVDVLRMVYESRIQALRPTVPEGEQPAPLPTVRALLPVHVERPRRLRNPAHLRHVASLPCLVCGRQPSHAHHLLFAQPRAMSRKVSDEWTVPLCAIHHDELHRFGDEQTWWRNLGIEPLMEAERLWRGHVNGTAVLEADYTVHSPPDAATKAE